MRGSCGEPMVAHGLCQSHYDQKVTTYNAQRRAKRPSRAIQAEIKAERDAKRREAYAAASLLNNNTTRARAELNLFARLNPSPDEFWAFVKEELGIK